MDTIIYSTHKFEKEFLVKSNADKHKLKFVELPLSLETAYLAEGTAAISIFVNDDGSEKVLDILNKSGVKFLALRSAGFNHVNLPRCKELGIRVARVPAYSPFAVA